MTEDRSNPWRTLASRVAYENQWIRLRHHDVIRPDGQPGIYGVVHFKNKAVGVLPLDEEGNTYLVGQFRFTIGQYSWELPEGGCPEAEDPLAAAKRELREETGLEARRWEQLGRAYLSNSVSDEEAILYLATELSQGDPSPEETEILQLRKVPFSEALRMVMEGEITDAMSIMAILLWESRGSRGKSGEVGIS